MAKPAAIGYLLFPARMKTSDLHAGLRPELSSGSGIKFAHFAIAFLR